MSLNHVKSYNEEIRQWLIKVAALAAAIPKGSLAPRKCPVCGAGESSFFADNSHLDYVRCGNCALVYMNPAPDAELVDQGFQGEDELLMEYFSLISRYKGGIPERPDPAADNKLKDIYRFKTSGRLLDLGCSVGDFLHKAKHFYQAEGLEVNPLTAAIAEQHFTVHKGFLAELALKPVYDIVTLHQILYGLPDPVGLLRDIHRILKQDGLLYINTPNADSYAVELYRGKVNHLYGYTTLNLFNESSLSALAARCGFKVLSLRTEWLDIYLSDLTEFYDHPDRFIHKRNCHLPNYERKMAQEDGLQQSLYPDLGRRGNYLVAVLGKADGVPGAERR
ncbi:SAM-dependent methyltransferase, putative [Citrifermentans bemidjiense Bem]|uniref:SAM-dependent methyltransferase, putative n=1 Tax=Citrifermentans bemidjiense (strain ATCC BAA-1014 / DSM 16622 / JCM 12645 / Bem) TaxID=404380 RepID=B5EDU9_CITBB|nr:methyltransferase domain-containing protein [Citrifermentans bemidjiense]ACH40727.1 SAM-dependent methyltransferase, putative [Citrifermentans bemidjiense Bem]